MRLSTWTLARALGVLLLLAVLGVGPAGTSALAAGCEGDELGATIDASSEELRAINTESAGAVRERIVKLRKTRAWSEAEFLDEAPRLMQTAEITAADERISELLGRIDALGDETSEAAASTDCATRRAMLAALTAELHDTMRGKWRIVLANFDREIALAKKARKAVETSAGEASVAAVPEGVAPEEVDVATIGSASPSSWTTTTVPDPDYEAAGSAPAGKAEAVGTAPTTSKASLVMTKALATYSASEIRNAGSGFFGGFNAELAGVIGHVFEKAGKPTGYILGNEGGGAFVAGLRYGSGRLHTKLAGSRRVFWRGPSIGYDFGAEGARTMILVYELDDPEEIYERFAGVDGSAYFVGGVGVTFLTDGKVMLAPIRSGLGLRLGASLGYLSFSKERELIPF